MRAVPLEGLRIQQARETHFHCRAGPCAQHALQCITHQPAFPIHGRPLCICRLRMPPIECADLCICSAGAPCQTIAIPACFLHKLCTGRAARFCYGAAHGGQIMMPLPLAQRIVHEWASEHFDLHDQLAEVPVFCSTRPHDGLLTAQHATRAMNSIEVSHPPHNRRSKSWRASLEHA